MSVATLIQVCRERLSPAKQTPSPETRQARRAIIELIMAGRDMAERLTLPSDNPTECMCGGNLAQHKQFCPVDRFYCAVDVVRRTAL